MLTNSITETNSPPGQSQPQPQQSHPKHQINKHNFTFCYIIGKGGFGKVWKVQYKKTKEVFALKEMSKLKVLDKKSEKSINSERQFLSFLRHPFIVNMHYAFQDNDNLYLVMDMLSGGDLRYHISRYRSFSEEQTRFFIACMVHSIDYIHKNNVIHRDMKPENLVMDDRGYIRITDFGIAKENCKDNSSETSGTPGYMSPEVMNGKHHSFSVDYFAIGVIGYEFMTGRRPYYGKNRKEIKEQMMSKQAMIKVEKLPHGWSEESMDFINRLLIRKTDERLGVNGAKDLKEHSWLRYYPWERLEKKKIDAPFIPEKKDNFDKRYCEGVDKISQDTLMRYEELLYEEKYKRAFVRFYYNKEEMKSIQLQKMQMIQVMQQQLLHQQGLNTTRETSHVQSLASNYNTNKSTTAREVGSASVLNNNHKEKEQVKQKDMAGTIKIPIPEKKINEEEFSNNNDMNDYHRKSSNKSSINIQNYIQKKYIQILHKHNHQQKNYSHNNSLNLSSRYQPIPNNQINPLHNHHSSKSKSPLSKTARDDRDRSAKKKSYHKDSRSKETIEQQNKQSSLSTSLATKTKIINKIIASSSNYFSNLQPNKIKYEMIPKKSHTRSSSGIERRDHLKDNTINSSSGTGLGKMNSAKSKEKDKDKRRESELSSMNIYKKLSRVNSMNRIPSRHEKDFMYNQMKSSVSALNSSKKLNYIK